MGFRTPDLGYSEVLRGIKSSTFKYFWSGSNLGTTFGPLLDRIRSKMDAKSDHLDVKMRVFRETRPPELVNPEVQNGVQNGSFWGTSRYFEVLLSLLKRFISLLRARAKVYSTTRSDPNPQGATLFGADLDPGATPLLGTE